MRTLIAIPVHNRSQVAKLCIPTVYRNRGNSVLHIYNDRSAELVRSDLAPFCDEVIELPDEDGREPSPETPAMGVHRLRWHQFRDFIGRAEFDHLYLTDSDALHDPSFMAVFDELVEKMRENQETLPVCLYNSTFHSVPVNEICGSDLVKIRRHAPGISQLYDRQMVEHIVRGLDGLGKDPDYHWDYIAPALLGRPFLTTGTSYLEHFGATPGSMHGTAGNWDYDHAVNPTPYLARIRQPVIDFLDGVTSRRPELI